MSWEERAACIGSTANFFPSNLNDGRQALEECDSCPVKGDCLRDALTRKSHDDHGVRGGTMARDRDRMRKRKR